MKKNILAENMIRFNAKNISEKTKKEILRLVEQDNQMNLNGVASSETVTVEPLGASKLQINDPSVEFITINTPKNKPAKAGDKLYAVKNRSGATITKLDSATIVVGKVGEFDTSTIPGTIIDADSPQVYIFQVMNFKKKILLGSGFTKNDEGMSKLFSLICNSVASIEGMPSANVHQKYFKNIISLMKQYTETAGIIKEIIADRTRLAKFQKMIQRNLKS